MIALFLFIRNGQKQTQPEMTAETDRNCAFDFSFKFDFKAVKTFTAHTFTQSFMVKFEPAGSEGQEGPRSTPGLDAEAPLAH